MTVRRSPSRPLAALALLVAAVGLFACARKPFQVVYYYKAGAPGLDQRLADVAALEKEFPGQVVVRSIDAASPEAQRDLEKLEIGTAGIMVRNSNSIMIYKQGETYFSIAGVRRAIREALGRRASS